MKHKSQLRPFKNYVQIQPSLKNLAIFHNLVALTPTVCPTPINTFVNLNTDVYVHVKVKGKPIQSREQFITVCSRVGVKDNREF